MVVIIITFATVSTPLVELAGEERIITSIVEGIEIGMPLAAIAMAPIEELLPKSAYSAMTGCKGI
jgi:hypothetical protein